MRFRNDCLSERDFGRITPYTFMDYAYSPDRIPNPVAYKRLIYNSWPNKKERIRVLRYLYQLLILDPPFGCKKLVVKGDTASGKSCMVMPFLAFLPMRSVATIVDEGKFCAHLINKETRLVLLEEWNEGKKFYKKC